MTWPNCEVGYHIWKSGPGYSECQVCHLIERGPEPEDGGDRGGP